MPKIDFRNPRTQKIGMAVIVFLGINYLFFLTEYLPFFYIPKKIAVEEKRVKYEQLALRVEEAKRASANLPRLEAELDELHAEWEVAMSHLPEKKEIASLLRRVTLAGERAGVRFLLFEPTDVFGNEVYDEHPVSVKVEGGFHGIGGFLGRLMNLDRIVRVSGIQLRAFRNDEEDQVVHGEMTVSAFTVSQMAAAGAVAADSPQRAERSNGHSVLDDDDSNEE